MLKYINILPVENGWVLTVYYEDNTEKRFVYNSGQAVAIKVHQVMEAHEQKQTADQNGRGETAPQPDQSAVATEG